MSRRHGDDTLPLQGKKVIVTRPRPQAGELVARLAAAGADVIEAPAIGIQPPEDPRPLEEALREIAGFDWVVFTSANGVEAVAEMADLSRCRVAAVGPGTRAALEARGVKVDLMPRTYRVDALAAALVARGKVEGVRFLLPRADRANPVLPEVLRREGGEVTQVIAYRTVPEETGADEARAALESKEVDFLTFTSASTVRAFVGLVGAERIQDASPPLQVATIGPETSRAAGEEGIPVHLEADPHTIPGLLAVLGVSGTRN